METQNITLSVPKKVLNKFKELAFRKRKSVSGLMVEMIEDAVSKEDGYQAAQERSLSRLDLGSNLGTQGRLDGKRDDLHER
jgi:hypothetical protein